MIDAAGTVSVNGFRPAGRYFVALGSPESKKKLDDLLAGKSGEHMILVKIWLPDATLVYSTNKEAIGGRFPSPHITAALEGKATSEFDYLQDPENAADACLHTQCIFSPPVGFR